MNSNYYRYERKFFISELTKQEVELIVKLHPALFSEIYHQRTVNNIYFDFLDFNNYCDNVIGIPNRIKYRIRWYGELFQEIKKPVLELKIKNNLLGKKESFIIQSFKIDNDFCFQILIGTINKSDIPEIVKNNIHLTIPTLLNRYCRKYYLSADGRYRVTIDFNQQFYKIVSQNYLCLNEITDNTNVILELKYNQEEDNEVEYITNYFPFRLTKSSKYITGIDKLNY